MRSIMWRRDDGIGLERCELEQLPDGWRIAGTTLLVAEDQPHEIRYSVITDASWRTRTVGAHVRGPSGDRRLALTADGQGNWAVSDAPVLGLYGAVDIDLAWTPSTNTVAIRRLDLAVGDAATTTVARARFPEHDIERVAQRYERVAESVYRYASGDVEFELTVDGDGLVTAYPGAFTAVASS